MSLTKTPPGQEEFSYNVIIPAQVEFGCDIPAGDGKLANLFYGEGGGSEQERRLEGQ